MNIKPTSDQKKALRTLVGTGVAHAVSIALNELDSEGLGRALERHGDELRASVIMTVTSKLREFSVSDQFTNEEVPLNQIYQTYPKEYRGLKPIGAQVDIIAEAFGLSLGYTSEYVAKVLPTLTLPAGAEGWAAFPSVDAIAKRYFPEVTDQADKYCRAVELLLEKLGKSREFYNYREGEINSKQLRQLDRTLHALKLITETQKGDILIIPVQCGMLHRGRSVRRARECFTANEFGLGALFTGCLALTHPERYVRWEQLHTDCAGDEFAPDDGYGFSHAPCFLWFDGKFRFDARWFDVADGIDGSASAFLLQT